LTSTLRTDVLRIEGAADPVSGLLPILHGIRSLPVDVDGVDAEMRHNVGYGAPYTLLPYTRRSGYDRERRSRQIPVVVLENEVLAATFLPRYGGRLWSLVHRPTGRELLHRNPILQPANLALRDAWLAGGVEWNLGTTGHWPLTCEPLHAAQVSADDGTPVLRMFEFERLRRLVLRIDAWLPASSPVLYVNVSIHNPSRHETPVYWWSNIAVPEHRGVRVLAPADHAFHSDYVSPMRRVGFPRVGGVDASYPGRARRAADFFLDIPDGQRRWIAALDETGAGLVQTSTPVLRGRKLFCWGTSTGGRHWQEWLSGPDSTYLEIQAGLARTQMEHLPMPAGAAWTWTEAFGMLEVDPGSVHASWHAATTATAEALERLVSADVLDRAHASAAEFGPPQQTLAAGSGWAALEVEAGALSASALLPFGMIGADQQPWKQLWETGGLPECDPPAAPVTGAHWRQMLEKSARDWHALYQLGLMRLADGENEAAREAWLRSLDQRPTPWSLRALASLATTAVEAADLMLQAHSLRPDLLELTIEVLETILRAGRPKDALAIIQALPEPLRRNGRIRLAEANAAHATGDDDRARHLLAEGIRVDNVHEFEASLDRLWLAVHPDTPVPVAYDFRMADG
jgi:hypothetical protein